MPYGEQRRYQRLTLSEPTYWVELRELSTIDVAEVLLASEQPRPDGTIARPFTAIAIQTLSAAIRAWNLDDADGVTYPLAEAGFRRLLPDDLNLLLRRATRGTSLRPIIDGIIGTQKEGAEPAEADFRRGAVPAGGGLAAPPAGSAGAPGESGDRPGDAERAPGERAA